MRFKNHSIPLFGLFLFIFFVGLLNFTPNTFLTGGDNLHPEFNFAINIKRSLFTTWQEYQGVGLLGGMGHGADLIRQVVLWVFSQFLPISSLRFLWTMSTLFIGATGAYVLIYLLFKKMHQSNVLFPFLGGLFYVFNLATIQAFYTPFEVFTAHFASLPWLFVATTLYFEQKTKKRTAFLILVALLTSPAGYVPTLFLVSVIGLSILFPFLSHEKKMFDKLKEYGKFIGIVIGVNAFWLLPFLYFVLTNAQVNIHAKINQMATETIFLQNKEFGNIWDIMLLKGFWLNNVDVDFDGTSIFLMQEWRNHLASPVILFLGYLFFAITAFGIYKSYKTKSKLLLGYCAIAGINFVLLTTATFPFSLLNNLLRFVFPLLSQIFRFPFTKFSILLSLMYAVFFSFGMYYLLQVFVKKLPYPKAIRLIPVFMVFLLMLYVLPVFTSHMFFKKEKIAIPKEYFDLFALFQREDPNTRIANFPQHTFWGWNFYRWGYGGSGFIWYGIQQPILDRAFDVWSATNEGYYFELSNALYKKDAVSLDRVLQKYQVQWIVIDKNIIYPISSKSLFFKELKDMLSKIPTAQKTAQFGNIEVYKLESWDNPKSFVFTKQNLPIVNTYTWNDFDNAYKSIGTYINTSKDIKISTYAYPIRSLFSKKTQTEKEYSLEKTKSFLTLSAPFSLYQESVLRIPSYPDQEELMYTVFKSQKTQRNTSLISAYLSTPELYSDTKKLYGETIEIPLFEVPENSLYPLTLNINGVSDVVIQKKGDVSVLGKSYLSLVEDNLIVINDAQNMPLATNTVTSGYLRSVPSLAPKNIPMDSIISSSFIVKIPILEQSYFNFKNKVVKSDEAQCLTYNAFRKGTLSFEKSPHNSSDLILSSKNSTACIALYAQTLSHRLAYAVFAEAENLKGRGMHFWILNEDEKSTPIDTYLPSDKKTSVNSFILPPQAPFGKSYSFHFDNVSIGNEEVKNTFKELSVFPVPYNFLSNIVLFTDSGLVKTQNTNSILSVSHPNESLYIVEHKNGVKNETLILSQAYDTGWTAYDIGYSKWHIVNSLKYFLPFVFGKELPNHVKINNWENGWVLENHTPYAISNTQIVIIYLPQYLQYLGFCITGCILLWVVYKHIRKDTKTLTE